MRKNAMTYWPMFDPMAALLLAAADPLPADFVIAS
jgi:hypothetical protein